MRETTGLTSKAYEAAVRACCRAKDVDHMQLLLTGMRAEGFEPSAHLLEAVAKTCEHAGEWRACVGIFNELHKGGFEAPTPTTMKIVQRAAARLAVEEK